VRSMQNGNLEACLKGLEILGIDIAVLTETKIVNEIYTKSAAGYEVFATKAVSTSRGGVALAIWRQRGKQWETEDLERFGPNVIACTLVSGNKRTRLIGVYFPPNEVDDVSIDSMVKAAKAAKDPVTVLGDFNANLAESTEARLRGQLSGLGTGNGGGEIERRRVAVAAAVASLGLNDTGHGFKQKANIGTWTWQMHRRGVRVRSVVDYILMTSTFGMRRHRVRQCQYVGTDHWVVYVDLPLAATKKHKRYAFSFRNWPSPLPKGDNMTAADKLFQKCLDSKLPPEKRKPGAIKPSWISLGTWKSIRLKADMRRLWPTPVRRAKTRRLKKII
jgi:exonuclease III